MKISNALILTTIIILTISLSGCESTKYNERNYTISGILTHYDEYQYTLYRLDTQSNYTYNYGTHLSYSIAQQLETGNTYHFDYYSYTKVQFDVHADGYIISLLRIRNADNSTIWSAP